MQKHFDCVLKHLLSRCCARRRESSFRPAPAGKVFLD
ncbi:uncharacterized protein CELE_F46A8.7 [Caenorhabditis elegans]|uniref:Uncharacterized protein n=1 Tax=Caenorhabditis elegans TaxID=6239 RepID=O01333_CAEEL|nr:Uncharacterized protein CELE_F46A8.7 [Caenorhabditis elegans]CAB04393.1 Uncharacterized protein CELE_F46A8.7 [Caenorhabditis elegans]|eukprot:NP_492882.1 Uncharacterized protein CELE_F46A8.7 [Caenorhabditis elegans]